MVVALYCDERQWIAGGGDDDAWPSVDVVQRIVVAVPVLYFSDLRSLLCLTSHRFWFRLGEFSGLRSRPVTVQELRRFEEVYDRRTMSTWRAWQTQRGGAEANGAAEGADEGAAGSRHEGSGGVNDGAVTK
eukprot:SAG11_NODE_2174_length_3719_cov_4.843094_4_plen_131_part_00